MSHGWGHHHRARGPPSLFLTTTTEEMLKNRNFNQTAYPRGNNRAGLLCMDLWLCHHLAVVAMGVVQRSGLGGMGSSGVSGL